MAAGIVLAGGRSSRMGMSKAALEWHRSTLLRRTVGVLARAVDGPVVVVRAQRQALPPLPAWVEVVEDPADDLGPLLGVATGLAAATGDLVSTAFVCATDLPFLHPAFVRYVVDALDDRADVALPHVHGHLQPSAAAYRTTVAPVAAELVAAGERRLTALFEPLRVRRLDESTLLDDPVLAAADPVLDSVVNVNTPAEYSAARRRPAARISVDGRIVYAATLAGAAVAARRSLDAGTAVWLNGVPVAPDGELPLVTGDAVGFQQP